MVAKITYGQRIEGVLFYNKLKIDKAGASVLACHILPIAPTDGYIDTRRLAEAFRPFFPPTKRGLSAPVFHVSLNPHPLDSLSDEQLVEAAHFYMERMGYGDQPYVIYKHTDIARAHLHIVSSRIRPDRTPVNDKNWKLKSKSITDEMERLFRLHPKGREQAPFDELRQIDYAAGNLKTQIASVALNLIGRYNFCSLNEYNTLLEQFNLSVEACKGEIEGRKYAGILYGALDRDGQRVGPPIKASSISALVGYRALQRRCVKTKIWMEKNPRRLDVLRRTIRKALREARNPDVFYTNLREAGVTVVFRRSRQADERIFGVTFIDHKSGLVLNGSRLGKEFAANRFEAYFRQAAHAPQPMERASSGKTTIPEAKQQTEFDLQDTSQSHAEALKTPFFELLDKMDFMGELLDEAAQNDPWEEWQQIQRQKKKRRRTKR